MDAKARYRTLCATEPTIPIFLQAWWLDATCGDQGWDVVVVAKGDEIHAALPFAARRTRGFRILSQPKLTPFLGPWLRATGAKPANEYGRQKDLMTELIAQLPRYDHYQQNWAPTVTNWLPFHWQGFMQSTGYTYVLHDLSDIDALWRGLRENIRREIRRAHERNGLTVVQEDDLDAFQALNKMTFSRQDRARPYTDDYVRQFDAACAERQSRRIFIARDAEGRAHAGVYIVFDADKAYYLMGGGDPDLRNSGATSLCMWEAICFSAGVSRAFDFEGSMIEPVERFFRAFGAEQVPYFRVSRTPSRKLSALMGLRNWISRR